MSASSPPQAVGTPSKSNHFNHNRGGFWVCSP